METNMMRLTEFYKSHIDEMTELLKQSYKKGETTAHTHINNTFPYPEVKMLVIPEEKSHLFTTIEQVVYSLSCHGSSLTPSTELKLLTVEYNRDTNRIEICQYLTAHLNKTDFPDYDKHHPLNELYLFNIK